MSTTNHYGLRPVKSGDTTRNRVEIRYLPNGAPKDLTGASIKIQFRPYGDYSYVAKTLQTPAAKGITIDNAEEGRFAIERFTADMKPGRHSFDIQITDADGNVTTLDLAGELKVKQDITQ